VSRDGDKGKQIDVRVFGSEGMLLYCGDDANPDSGSLQVVQNGQSPVDLDMPDGFAFEET
jgi:hypothetical protein